jgi:hypothetical protein
MSNLEKRAAEIQRAQADVARTRLAYSKGDANVDAVNNASQKLADAHDAYQAVSGGRIPAPR